MIDIRSTTRQEKRDGFINARFYATVRFLLIHKVMLPYPKTLSLLRVDLAVFSIQSDLDAAKVLSSLQSCSITRMEA
jgi:hypothetical protein